jgi:hypothetical protein
MLLAESILLGKKSTSSEPIRVCHLFAGRAQTQRIVNPPSLDDVGELCAEI